eukprot:CAMPEP_0115417238 /NCGR_PEP_ID=MMETSP0271-20121206/24022_1 /TAXON_ID=71861 /ORGANISM="Scrippsiella trochoidea, Strain CCMP3099" /LENGTH=976 /DNA_ID=CAMNT_0002841621 /DNA_START=32 /DNA_END=2965 /DNA_ORIENTATION=-
MVSRRLALMLVATSLFSRAFATSTGEGFDGRPVLDIDFYRATESAGIDKWLLQNMNLASVEGMTKYFHTEAIAEHVIGDVERKTRKYGIDAFTKVRFKVKNPRSVVATSSSILNQVDFGPFVTFDFGVATNPDTQTLIRTHGGFVGVQQQQDPRWPYSTPYYWFSITGWCPNVPYNKVPMTRQKAEQLLLNRSSLCSQLDGRVACEQSSEDCIYEEGRCMARDPAPECLNYTSASGHPGHVLGGLCPDGAQDLVQPTGEHGCTYSYAKAGQVSIDKVAGILDEDCGGRKCTTWIDFRQNCSNPDYRQKFNAATNRIEPFRYCIEYDISPLCQADCSNPACQALPDSEKELGLPFWQGRCNEQANMVRSEHVAASFHVARPGIDHDLTALGLDQKTSSAGCVYQQPGICAPSPQQGGNYCSRQWGGVCTACFVPGTSITWPATTMPYCPYDVLANLDYKDAFPSPKCASPHPRDLCCLYTGGCSLSASDPAQVPLDEDGYALAASWRNTSVMVTFLARVAEAHGWSVDMERLASFAYTQWGWSPSQGATLEEATKMMLELRIAVERTSTSSGTATTSSTAMGLDVVSIVEHEVGGSSPSSILIPSFCIGAAVTGLVLLVRHLSGRSAEIELHKDELNLAQAMACSQHAAVEPDLEAASLASTPPQIVSQVAVVDLPRLGLSSKAVATDACVDNEPVSTDLGYERALDQEFPQLTPSAALVAVLRHGAEEQGRKSSAGSSNRGHVGVDGPGEVLAVTVAQSSCSEKGLHIESFDCSQVSFERQPQMMIAALAAALPVVGEQNGGSTRGSSGWFDPLTKEIAATPARSSDSNYCGDFRTAPCNSEVDAEGFPIQLGGSPLGKKCRPTGNPDSPQVPSQNRPQTMMMAELDVASPVAEGQDGDSTGRSSSRTCGWCDAPDADLAVTGTPSSGSQATGRCSEVTSSGDVTLASSGETMQVQGGETSRDSYTIRQPVFAAFV